MSRVVASRIFPFEESCRGNLKRTVFLDGAFAFDNRYWAVDVCHGRVEETFEETRVEFGIMAIVDGDFG